MDLPFIAFHSANGFMVTLVGEVLYCILILDFAFAFISDVIEKQNTTQSHPAVLYTYLHRFVYVTVASGDRLTGTS